MGERNMIEVFDRQHGRFFYTRDAEQAKKTGMTRFSYSRTDLESGETTEDYVFCSNKKHFFRLLAKWTSVGKFTYGIKDNQDNWRR